MSYQEEVLVPHGPEKFLLAIFVVVTALVVICLLAVAVVPVVLLDAVWELVGACLRLVGFRRPLRHWPMMTKWWSVARGA